MEETMKRTIIITALLLCTANAAAAQVPQTMYKDLVRPNGQKRSAAAYQADVDACYRQTGGTPYLPDSAAMKKCMLSHGYRFVWQRGYDSGSRAAVTESKSGCMARQAQIAATIERSPAAAFMGQLARQLRTRCLPWSHNPQPDYSPPDYSPPPDPPPPVPVQPPAPLYDPNTGLVIPGTG
jgi:hypothetical protein